MIRRRPVGSRMLLVDDGKDIVDLMEEALRQENFTDVCKAYTGQRRFISVKNMSRIYKNGRELDLTGREFLLLSYLMENADRIISKERL